LLAGEANEKDKAMAGASNDEKSPRTLAFKCFGGIRFVAQ
jgi:hypothetical protein